MPIAENLERVRERIAQAAGRVGRDPTEVTIVAVTKTHGAETVAEAIRAGITDIGENRIQEFLSKSQAVKLECRWHLVGHLQTNKVNKAVGRFAYIQSVDSIRLADRLSRTGEERGVATNVLLEVNTSGEESKFGFAPSEAAEVYAQVAQLPGLEVRGLMTVGPWVEEESVVRAAFVLLRRLGEDIERAGFEVEHLSMGMTDDFEIAVEEGSTMIRLGRVLFGERR